MCGLCQKDPAHLLVIQSCVFFAVKHFLSSFFTWSVQYVGGKPDSKNINSHFIDYTGRHEERTD